MKIVVAFLVLISIGAASAQSAYENVKYSKPCKTADCGASAPVKKPPTQKK